MKGNENQSAWKICRREWLNQHVNREKTTPQKKTAIEKQDKFWVHEKREKQKGKERKVRDNSYWNQNQKKYFVRKIARCWQIE